MLRYNSFKKEYTLSFFCHQHTTTEFRQHYSLSVVKHKKLNDLSQVMHQVVYGHPGTEFGILHSPFF